MVMVMMIEKSRYDYVMPDIEIYECRYELILVFSKVSYCLVDMNVDRGVKVAYDVRTRGMLNPRRR